MRHPIVIAGAGIGGLTAAIALRRAGLPVRVLERASKLRATGAGLTIQTNAMLALRVLGLDGQVRAEGQELTDGALAHHRGRELVSMALGQIAEELGAYGVGIHRKRLAKILRAAADVDIEFEARVRGFETMERGVSVRVEGRDEPVLASALLGCDGLHSEVRRHLVGAGPLRYAGYTTWRGIAYGVEDSLPPGHIREIWGPGARFGVVPLGHGELYWFAVINAPADGKDGPEGHRHAVLEHFGSWAAPVPRIVEATVDAEILRTDINDRPPVKSWVRGRVALLGDAAHPMTPNMGQGAGQAIEDAVVLGELARTCGGGDFDLEALLADYQAKRLERANEFVLRSRQMGAIGQWRGPVARWARDWGVRLTPTNAMVKRLRASMTPPQVILDALAG